MGAMESCSAAHSLSSEQPRTYVGVANQNPVMSKPPSHGCGLRSAHSDRPARPSVSLAERTSPRTPKIACPRVTLGRISITVTPTRAMSATFLAAMHARVADAISSRERSTDDPIPLSPAAPARPLRHVVSFKCADWSPAKADELGAALDALPASIKELGAFHHGPDMGLREAGYNMDYAITADFDDQASYTAFCHHPAYLKVVSDVIKPLLAPGEPVARMQFKIEHNSRARQTLMRADPALFDIRFGKAVREPDSPESVIAA